MGFILPAVAAIGSLFTAGAFTAALVQIGIGVGLMLVSQLLRPDDPEVETVAGTNFDVDLGSDVPRNVVFGRCGTAGHLVHVNTHGDDNKYIQLVYVLSDGTIDGINHIYINGEIGTLIEQTPLYTEQKRYWVTGYDDLIELRFYDGRNGQVADGGLVADADPPELWTTAHKLTGMSYVVIEMKHDRDALPYRPDFFFDINGLKLYDFRKDSTNGGVGSHRWDNRATWEFSENPAVCSYNFRRGIYVNGQRLIGMGMKASELLTSHYVAAANICDEQVPVEDGGGNEPRYRVSAVVYDDVEFRDALATFAAAMAGYDLEFQGRMAVIAGASQVPVMTITDADLVLDSPLRYTAKRSRADLINGLFGKYAEPDDQWELRAYPPIVIESDIAEDGEELHRDIDYPQCRSATQAQRIARIRYQESRHQATATIVLRYSTIPLTVGDWIVWDSEMYGLKKWRIVNRERTSEMRVRLELEGVSELIYSWDGSEGRPYVPPPIRNPKIGQTTIFGLTVTAINFGGGPALHVTWTPTTDHRITDAILEYRIVGETVSEQKVVHRPEDGGTVIAGLLSNAGYEVRATIRTRPPRVTTWTEWVQATSPELNPWTGIDVTPPGRPEDIVITSELVGNIVKLTATWPDVAATDHYDVEIKEGSGNFVMFQTDTNTIIWEDGSIKPSTLYSIRVRARDGNLNGSAWSDVVTHMTLGDNVPPAIPQNVEAIGGFHVIWLKWDIVTDSDLAKYEIYQSTSTTPPGSGTAATYTGFGFEFVVAPVETGVTLYFWIRSVDLSGNKSDWSEMVTAQAIGLTAEDIENEIITTAAFAQGIEPVGIVNSLPNPAGYTGPKFVLLTTDDKVYRYTGSAWTKAVDGGDIIANSIVAGKIAAGAIGVTELAAGSVNADKLAAGSVTATKVVSTGLITLTAQINDGIITNAKIVDLSAAKLTAGSALAGSITVSGQTISSIADAANNPAGTINQGTTLIDPGKILISGPTTLASWKSGTDATKIDGGEIAANSIRTNSIEIGARNVTIEGLEIWADKATNRIVWSSGWISYVRNDGGVIAVQVPSGAIAWASGTIYLYWAKGAGDPPNGSTVTLSSHSSPTVANGANNLVLATYRGGTDIVVTKGVTLIDGTQIVTNTVTANQMLTGSLTADKIAVGTITADRIQINGITTNRLALNSVTNSYGASSAGSATFALGAAYTTIFSIATSPTGSRVMLEAAAGWRSNTDLSADIIFGLFRGETQINEVNQGNRSLTNGHILAFDADGGSGTVTYSLRARMALSASVTFRDRFISALVLKR